MSSGSEFLANLWGAQRRRSRVSVAAEILAYDLASREQLRAAAQRYLEASTREIINLRRENDRLKRQVVSLQRQVEELTVRLEEELGDELK